VPLLCTGRWLVRVRITVIVLVAASRHDDGLPGFEQELTTLAGLAAGM
jgi:hypothetical protein